MTTLIKLGYAGAIMALLILAAAFGVRTVYPPPEEPRYPQPPIIRPPSAGEPTQPEWQEYERQQRLYQERFEAYLEERATYRRNVFLGSTVLALVAIAAGVSLNVRLDAMRLGLVLGGLGTLVYGVAQAGGDLDRVGSALVFVVAVAGLGLLLLAGYRWLAVAARET